MQVKIEIFRLGRLFTIQKIFHLKIDDEDYYLIGEDINTDS